MLHLHHLPPSYHTICDGGGATLCVRERLDDSHLKCHSILIDTGNEDLVQGTAKPTVVVPFNSDSEWHVVKPHESVIFINQAGM